MTHSIDAAFTARKEPVVSDPDPNLASSMTGDTRGALIPDTSTGRPAVNYLLIDAGSSLTGNLIFDGDILLRGKFTGAIRCRSLLVDQGAVLEAAVTARQVTIRGAASGSIDSDCVRIERTAVVDSEIRQKQIKREEGARTRDSLVEADAEVTARQDSLNGPAASDSLMVRLTEFRRQRQSDPSPCRALDK
jgi:cytoskeletal protein CcmA (bactofilin family)